MVAYSFKPMFVTAIQEGTKRQTIRRPRYGRSRHAAPGGPVTLLTGARFSPTLLGRTTCEAIFVALLDFTADGHVTLHNQLTGDRLAFGTPAGLDQFAKSDGFENWAAMKTFWRDVHDTSEFEGTLIKWGYPFHVQL